MTAWTAIWAPDRAALFWELTVTDEAGNVAMRERSHSLLVVPQPGDALVASQRPGDGVLATLSLRAAGEWVPGEGGSWSCPVTASQGREDALVNGLLARGRSYPGRAHDGEHGTSRLSLAREWRAAAMVVTVPLGGGERAAPPQPPGLQIHKPLHHKSVKSGQPVYTR